MRAVNLIPADQRSSGANAVKGRSNGGAFIVIALIAGLAIFTLLYGSARHQVSSRRGEAAKLTAEAQVAESQASQLSAYTSFISLHNERVNDIAQLVGTRFDWAHVFHELGRVLPADVSLSSVQGAIGNSSTSGSSSSSASATSTAPSAGGSVSSATPPGSTPTLTLAGCTTSQSEVAVALARLHLIDGVSEVQLQSSSKGGSGGGSSSGSSSASSCPPGDPTFNAVVTFTALPTPSSSTSSSTTSTAASTTTAATSTADTSAAGTSSGTSTASVSSSGGS